MADRARPRIHYKRMSADSVSIFGERAFLKGGGRTNSMFDTTGETPVEAVPRFGTGLLLDDFDRLYLGWLDSKQPNAENRKKAVRYVFRIVFGEKMIDKDTNTLYNKFEWAYLKWMKSVKARDEVDDTYLSKVPCVGSELFSDFKMSILFRLKSLFYETGSAERIFGESNTYTKQKKVQYYGLLKLVNRMDMNPVCYDYYNDISLVTGTGVEEKKARDDNLIHRILCNVYLSTLPEEQKREIIDEITRRSGYVFDPTTCSVPGPLGAPPPAAPTPAQAVPGQLGAPPAPPLAPLPPLPPVPGQLGAPNCRGTV